MVLGLTGALLASICYGAAAVLQAVGIRRFAATPADLPMLARLGRARLYVLGLALDLVGFLASVVALRTLPLFLVQSVIATSVAVTALLAARFLGARLRRSEVVALVVVVVGLVCLAVTGESTVAHSLARTGSTILLLAIAPTALVALAALVAERRPSGLRPLAGVNVRGPHRGVVLLAIAAGIGFGGVGIAARVLVIPDPWWHVVGDPVAWALVGYAALAVICYALALAGGRVTMVAALTVALETSVPAAVGLGWLGDAVRPGFGTVAAIGFVATVGGCLALCRNEDLVNLEQSVSGWRRATPVRHRLHVVPRSRKSGPPSGGLPKPPPCIGSR